MMESVALTDSAMVDDDDFIVVTSTPPPDGHGGYCYRFMERINLGHEGDIENEDDDSYDMISQCDMGVNVIEEVDEEIHQMHQASCYHLSFSQSSSSSCSSLMEDDESDFASAAAMIQNEDMLEAAISTKPITVEASLRAVKSLVTSTLESARVQVWPSREQPQTFAASKPTVIEKSASICHPEEFKVGDEASKEEIKSHRSGSGYIPDARAEDEGCSTVTSNSLQSAPTVAQVGDDWDHNLMEMMFFSDIGTNTYTTMHSSINVIHRMKKRKGKRRLELFKQATAAAAAAAAISKLNQPPSSASCVTTNANICKQGREEQVHLYCNPSVPNNDVLQACHLAIQPRTLPNNNNNTDGGSSDEDERPPFATGSQIGQNHDFLQHDIFSSL